jgi:hypothetical protein
MDPRRRHDNNQNEKGRLFIKRDLYYLSLPDSKDNPSVLFCETQKKEL